MKFFLLVLGVLVVAYLAFSVTRGRTAERGPTGSTPPPAPRTPEPVDAPPTPIASPEPVGSSRPLNEAAPAQTTSAPMPPAPEEGPSTRPGGTDATGSAAVTAMAEGDDQPAGSQDRVHTPGQGRSDSEHPSEEEWSTGRHDEGEAADAATGDPGQDTDSLDEIRDGGYGVGSAAPLDSGDVPIGHPVKAWNDTRTFMTPDHPHYRSADPHVWFTDAEAAHRAGFAPVDG